MGRIANEVINAAAELGVQVREVPEGDRLYVRDNLLRTFTAGLETWPPWIWEHVFDEYATRCSDGWRAVGKCASGSEVIMLFNPDEDEVMLTFQDGEDAVRVLEVCSGFEVYFTDKLVSFFLMHNHHDCLIVCGAMKSIVQAEYPLLPC